MEKNGYYQKNEPTPPDGMWALPSRVTGRCLGPKQGKPTLTKAEDQLTDDRKIQIS
jgi:hypothetical protein